ncbi:MAG: L,D-transpeptidase family protein [bacterium]|nr:L,D-transpeptidase family protein [bacterium]
MNGIVVYRTVFVALAVGAIFGVSTIQQEEKEISTPPSLVVVDRPLEVATSTVTATISEPKLFQYIEVVDGCDNEYKGSCVNVRSGPSEEHPVVMRLRTGVVLKIADTIIQDGRAWHKILFDDWVRYPERVSGDWFVSAEYVRLFTERDQNTTDAPTASSTKKIIVDRSDQKMYAYEGDTLFMEGPTSTGLELTPTPRGTFSVYKKTPSRYMQGPLPGISDQYYDLPGVPWNLYFTMEGGVIHGAYWHNKFGQPWSHGCVNLPPSRAQELYQWADVGTVVIVRD